MSPAASEIVTTDYHTAGEPFRIVVGGAPDIPGASVGERREHALASAEVDGLRRLLCHEPRGHADMYGCFLVPPDDAGADLGALFWHKDGFSTACGHGTIALGAWAVESGRMKADPDGETDITIDVPSGRVLARVACSGGRPVAVTFRNVPSYVLARSIDVTIGGRTVAVDVAYGGAIYASVEAASLDLRVTPKQLPALVAAGRAIKAALEGSPAARHPSDERLSGIYGTILYEQGGREARSEQAGSERAGSEAAHGRVVRQRNVAVFADGEVDRSPCGSGTSARAALLHAEGRLALGAAFIHESIVGTEFEARVTAELESEGRPVVITEVSGAAFKTGEHRFVLDPRDPLGTGFVLR